MALNEIVFDPSTFIWDRYFSSKSKYNHRMDIYKDKGRILPIIPPVRHHLEVFTPNKRKYRSSSNKKSKQKQRLDESSSSEDSVELEAATEPVIEDHDNHENHDQILDNLERVDRIKEAIYAEKKRIEQEKEIFIEKKKRSQSPKQFIEDSKPLLKLESPADIFHRITEIRQVNNKDMSEHKVTYGRQRLKKIVKKLDLVVEVGGIGENSKVLNQMRKLPLKYFQKARILKERSGSRVTTLEDSEASVIHVENEQSQNVLDVSQEIMPVVILKNGSETDPSKKTTTRNLSKFSTSNLSRPQKVESLVRDVSATDFVKNESKLFFSQMSQYTKPKSSFARAGEDISVLFTPNQRDKNSLSVIHSRSSSYHNTSFDERGITGYGKKNSVKMWMMKKVHNLEKEINMLKTETSSDLGLIGNYRKKIERDVGSIKGMDKKIIKEDEEKLIDKEYYNEAIKVKNDKFVQAGLLPKNIMTSKSAIKNAKEREIDNIKFEKLIVKIERKVLEKARAKSLAANPKKPYQSNMTKCKHL